MVYLHNAFVFMEKTITPRSAVFLNTTDEESQHPKRQNMRENCPYCADINLEELKIDINLCIVYEIIE